MYGDCGCVFRFVIFTRFMYEVCMVIVCGCVFRFVIFTRFMYEVCMVIVFRFVSYLLQGLYL